MRKKKISDKLIEYLKKTPSADLNPALIKFAKFIMDFKNNEQNFSDGTTSDNTAAMKSFIVTLSEYHPEFDKKQKFDFSDKQQQQMLSVLMDWFSCQSDEIKWSMTLNEMIEKLQPPLDFVKLALSADTGHRTKTKGKQNSIKGVETIKAKAAAKHRQWQGKAADIWKTNPALPKSVVARRVAKETTDPYNTIRQNIINSSKPSK